MVQISALVAAAVLYHLASRIISIRQQRAIARQHGCAPPQVLKTGFYGLNEFRRVLVAARTKEVVEYVAARFRPGHYTFSMPIFGEPQICTIEPENVKTVLATKFNDYSLGKSRKNAFHDMLGDGIFTLNGDGWSYSRAMLRPQFARDQGQLPRMVFLRELC